MQKIIFTIIVMLAGLYHYPVYAQSSASDFAVGFFAKTCPINNKTLQDFNGMLDTQITPQQKRSILLPLLSLSCGKKFAVQKEVLNKDKTVTVEGVLDTKQVKLTLNSQAKEWKVVSMNTKVLEKSLPDSGVQQKAAPKNTRKK